MHTQSRTRRRRRCAWPVDFHAWSVAFFCCIY